MNNLENCDGLNLLERAGNFKFFRGVSQLLRLCEVERKIER